MTDSTDDTDFSAAQIIGFIDGLVQNAAAAKGQGTVPMTDLAIQAQVTQAVLTGYQVLSTMRMAEATEKAATALHELATHFGDGKDGTKQLCDALEGIRKVISSNGGR